MNTPISALLRHKGDWVITVDPETTVYDAIARMVEHNVGALVVTERGAVRGIFTERDYLRRIALEGRTSRTTRVAEVMTAGDLVTVAPDTTVDACLDLMSAHKVRHLPVLREGRLAGLISIGDCVRAISERARGRVEDLERFVSGGYTA